MEPNITVIVPTFGRTTLTTVVRDIVGQMHPGDQFIVAGDGPAPSAEARVAECDGLVEYVGSPERAGDYGCTPFDKAMPLARGHAIWFIGDDDRYPPGSLDAIRKAVAQQPDVVHVFSMMCIGRKLSRSLEVRYISGQQMVVPNRPDLPQWKHFPSGHVQVSDFHWIHRVINLVGRYQFHDEIICILERQNSGADL